MLTKDDTTGIQVDEPLDDVLWKTLHETSKRLPIGLLSAEGEGPNSSRLWIEDSRNTRLVSSEPVPKMQVDSSAETRPTLLGLLSAGAGKAARSLVLGLAAAQVDITRLGRLGQPTGGMSPYVMSYLLAAKEGITVTIAPGLVRSRAEVFASSLFAPSGALLTWLAMSGEEEDDD